MPEPKKKLTKGECTTVLPEPLMIEVMNELQGRGATSKTSLIVELLWEVIRARKKNQQWHSTQK